jgi:hypothetical protein
MRSRSDDLSSRMNPQRLARRIVWSDSLVRVLAELRARNPSASLELSALELALSDVTRDVESHLEAALCGAHLAGPGGQSAGTTSKA